MKLKLVYSILIVSLLSFPVVGQDVRDDSNTVKNTLRIKTDINGLLISPLRAAIGNNLESKYRIFGEARYIVNDKISIGLAYGKEMHNSNLEFGNFYEFRMETNYIQIDVSGHLFEANNKSIRAGIGLYAGNLSESGVALIGGGYFPEVRFPKEASTAFVGAFVTQAVNYDLSSRWNIELDGRVYVSQITDPSVDYLILSVPAGGENILNSTEKGLGLGVLLTLGFRVF